MTDARLFPLQPKRVLGLELAGAKSQKSAISVLEYYPKERKTFLLDVYDRIYDEDETSNDATLIATVDEIIEADRRQSVTMAVNVATTLPPCLPCTRKTCLTVEKCTVPAVKWMREISNREGDGKNFTPYTQRPMELWIRHKIFPNIPKEARFEIDEALGGSRAPLTARMIFLKPHFSHLKLIEALPKLTIAVLASQLRIPKRVVQTYRKPEQGHDSRAHILDQIIRTHSVFIYERDQRKLTQSLTAFDSFLCAFTALLSEQGATATAPRGFPKNTGWTEYPKF